MNFSNFTKTEKIGKSQQPGTELIRTLSNCVKVDKSQHLPEIKTAFEIDSLLELNYSAKKIEGVRLLSR